MALPSSILFVMSVVVLLDMLGDLRLVTELAEAPPRAVRPWRRLLSQGEARERGRRRCLRRLGRRVLSHTLRLPEHRLALQGRQDLRRRSSG